MFIKRPYPYLFYFLFVFFPWLTSLGVPGPSKCFFKKQPQPNLGEKSKHKFKSSLAQLNKHCFWHFILLTWLTCLLSTNATKCSEFQGRALDTLFLSLFILLHNHHLEKGKSAPFLALTSLYEQGLGNPGGSSSSSR